MSNREQWIEASGVLPAPERQSLVVHSADAVASFVQTKEYRRFVQVCEAGRRYGYIVACIGERGVGKTWAARQYAQWDVFGPLLSAHGVSFPPECPIPQTAFYTPKSTVTPKSLEQDLALLLWSLQLLADHALPGGQEALPLSGRLRPAVVNMLIVDEVDRLSHPCLAVLQDVFERERLCLVLLGRSGSAARLLRVDALASQTGVLHPFRTLEKVEIHTFLEQQVQRLGLSVKAEAVEVFTKKTRGNLRTMRLVLQHLDYMVERQGAFLVTGDVIEEAVGRLMNEKNVLLLRDNMR